MTVTAIADRPYLLVFHATGSVYPVSSADVRRLLESYPVVKATRNRLILPGHNTDNPKQRCTIQPATRGGGHCFDIRKD